MIMLDIETLGLKLGAKIITIGWCAFDWEGTTNSGTILIDGVDGQIDFDTVKFWLQQSPEAIAKTFFRNEPGMPLKEAVEEVRRLVILHGQDGVWANGPLFDLAHLEHWDFYSTSGPLWSHRLPRCYRTIMAVAEDVGFDRETEYERIRRQFIVTEHDAESDSIVQARLVIAARNYLVQSHLADAAKVPEQYPRDAIDAG